RFTTPLKNYPHLSPECENPEGVPLTAILFGGRREHVIPLVFEAFDWNHGVFLGSTMGVEQTAAAEGKVGEIRRDPMAMRPFCGYNVNEYFRHWIKIGKVARHPPGIFYVNWFRKDENGKFIWPGFGQNMRVIKWIIDKVEGRAKGRKTPIGYIPRLDELDTNGIAISSEGVSKLLSFNGDEWRKEVADMKKYIDSISPGYPDELLKIFSDLQGSL
ncbi:MAG TPA: phosphoenolpyruvate carboxykinase domain-containing protein, partial [Thermoplasmataceae archaeon]|nr:phosphoenolpyruvate carboxykinase domain-containing protein [Thermoplasmataceae archaeon]